MRGYSPPYYSPPRRGYGDRPRSPPPRRGYGGDRGRPKEQNHGSLLVRNIPLDRRPEELRVPFERFGVVRDVYLPKNYYTGEPRGFAFVQFVDPYDASEAQYHMDGQIFAGREIYVVVAAETRKKPEDMRRRTRFRGPSSSVGRQSSYYGRSCSRSLSPRYPSGSRSRHRSRSYSPAPRRRRSDYSLSPERSQQERDADHIRRSYSPGYDNADHQNGDTHGKKYAYSSPGRVSRSPSGSRSRSADVSPRRSGR